MDGDRWVWTHDNTMVNVTTVWGWWWWCRIQRFVVGPRWMWCAKDKERRATKRTWTREDDGDDRWKRRKPNANEGGTKRKHDQGDGWRHPSKRPLTTASTQDQTVVVSSSQTRLDGMEVGNDANDHGWNEDEQPNIPLPPSLHMAKEQISTIAPFEYLVQQNIRQHNMQVVPWNPAPNNLVDPGGQQERSQSEGTETMDETRPAPHRRSNETTQPPRNQDTNQEGTSMDTSMDEGQW